MERELVAGWQGSGFSNPLAGDRHYEGMVAPDGADISSRTKHREYMKRHGLTTVDDFKNTWSQEQKQREARRLGKHEDPGLRQTIERELYRRSQ